MKILDDAAATVLEDLRDLLDDPHATVVIHCPAHGRRLQHRVGGFIDGCDSAVMRDVAAPAPPRERFRMHSEKWIATGGDGSNSSDASGLSLSVAFESATGGRYVRCAANRDVYTDDGGGGSSDVAVVETIRPEFVFDLRVRSNGTVTLRSRRSGMHLRMHPSGHVDCKGLVEDDTWLEFAIRQVDESDDAPETNAKEGPVNSATVEIPNQGSSGGIGVRSASGATTAMAAGAVLGGAATSAAVPAAVSAVGYTSGGIAAGSWAAAAMSAEAIASGGGVAAGGFTATLQSVGAVGMGAGLAAGVAAVGAFAGVGAAWLGRHAYVQYRQKCDLENLLLQAQEVEDAAGRVGAGDEDVTEKNSDDKDDSKNVVGDKDNNEMKTDKGKKTDWDGKNTKIKFFVVQSRPWNRRLRVNPKRNTVHAYDDGNRATAPGNDVLERFELVQTNQALVVALRCAVTGKFVSVDDRCDVALRNCGTGVGFSRDNEGREDVALTDREKFNIWFVTDECTDERNVVTFRSMAFSDGYRYLRMHPTGHVDCEGRFDKEPTCLFKLLKRAGHV